MMKIEKTNDGFLNGRDHCSPIVLETSTPQMYRRGIGQKQEERTHYDHLIVAGAALLVGALILLGWIGVADVVFPITGTWRSI